MTAASQETQILEYLEAGNGLTPLEALDMFGCFRLGARIFGLKGRGHLIQTQIVERNGKRVAMYFIPGKEKGRVVEPHLGLLREQNKAKPLTGEHVRRVSFGVQGCLPGIEAN